MSRVFVSPLATPFHLLVSIFPIPSRYISIFRAPPPRYFSPSLTKRSQHSGTAIIGRAPPKPHDYSLRASTQGLLDQLTGSEGGSARSVAFRGQNQVNATGCRHFNHSGARLVKPAPSCLDFRPKWSLDGTDPPLSTGGSQDGVDGALTAVCHGHAHDLSVWSRIPHSLSNGCSRWMTYTRSLRKGSTTSSWRNSRAGSGKLRRRGSSASGAPETQGGLY